MPLLLSDHVQMPGCHHKIVGAWFKPELSFSQVSFIKSKRGMGIEGIRMAMILNGHEFKLGKEENVDMKGG